MISLKKLFEDGKKSRGIEEPNHKASAPNKAINKEPKPALTKKEPEPKPSTMSTQQAGGGSHKTAGTSDIQKVNGHKDLVAPSKNSAEREANAMGSQAPQMGPQNPYFLEPAAHTIGRPVTAPDLNKVIPPEIDRHGWVKTIIPGEIVQLCSPEEFEKFVNKTEDEEMTEDTFDTYIPNMESIVTEAYETYETSNPIERDMVVKEHELEPMLRAFHIGKNIALLTTQFSTERKITFPWPDMNDTVLVILRLAPNKEGKIVGHKDDDETTVTREEGPEARCTNVSKLLCPRQSEGTLHCIYVIDLEERMDEDGPLPPIKEDRGEIEADTKTNNPIFDKYMNGPVRQVPQKNINLKDVLPKNITDENI